MHNFTIFLVCACPRRSRGDTKILHYRVDAGGAKKTMNPGPAQDPNILAKLAYRAQRIREGLKGRGKYPRCRRCGIVVGEGYVEKQFSQWGKKQVCGSCFEDLSGLEKNW